MDKSTDYILLDFYLNHKTNIEKTKLFNKEMINDLNKVVDIYYSHNYNNEVEKYKILLDFVGNNEVTKLARDVRQCVINYTISKDAFEYAINFLHDDIIYIQRIIERNNYEVNDEKM